MIQLFNNLFSSKFFKYSLGGVINYFLKIGLTYFLTEILTLYYLLSYSITLVVVILYSFVYNMFITFNKTNDKLSKFIIYIIVLVIFGVIDLLLVKFFTQILGVYYILSIIIITTFIFLLKYLVFNKIVFK